MPPRGDWQATGAPEWQPAERSQDDGGSSEPEAEFGRAVFGRSRGSVLPHARPRSSTQKRKGECAMGLSLSTSKWGLAAIAGGVALTAIEVTGAVTYLVSQDSPSYLVAGGAIVTVVAAILPILAVRCWRGGRHYLALLLWAALLPALSLIFTAAVERTGGARDAANRERQVVAQRIELARETVKDAKVVADTDELAAKTECARAPKGADPRGPACKSLEARAENSRKRLEATREKLAQAGVVPQDPQARRIAAVLPGITEEAVHLYQPLVLPLAISILGLLLIAAGAHHPPKRRAPKAVVGRKRRRPAPRRKPQPKSLPDHVVRLPTHRGSSALH
jgi:hypothetical protein